MGYTVRHAAAAHSVLVAAHMEVAHYAPVRLTALAFRVQIGNIAECVFRVIGQRLLVVEQFIVSLNFFQTAELFDV